MQEATVSLRLATGGFFSVTLNSSVSLSVVPLSGHSKFAVIGTLIVSDGTEDGVKVFPETPVPLKLIPSGTHEAELRLIGALFLHTVWSTGAVGMGFTVIV